MIGRFLRILNTVRYLKFSQALYRIYFIYYVPKVPQKKSFKTRNVIKSWNSPVYQSPGTKDGKTYCFLGKTASLNNDWNPPSFTKLWLYNLHYQNDLNVIDTESRIFLNDLLVENWIKGNPPLKGNGWEPYCLSLRLVNWIKWFSRKPIDSLPNHWLISLGLQVSVLEQTVERHILANHLFANAKALVFAGTYFSGEEGARWLKKGLAILDAQINEQFFPDGGHYELSPMYHSVLLWDLADLINLANQSQLTDLQVRTGAWKETFLKGISWLQAMVHPDGRISFFNDSTFGIGPSLNDLSAYAEHLKLELPASELDNFGGLMLPESGYCSIGLSGGCRLIVDVGRLGPNYQPGHAHADTLSCELSLFGQRVLVNTGISQYGEGKERNRQRSTAAHNTVEVDGENSSEVWAGFRVARRAFPIGIEYSDSEDCIRISAAHSGYRRLKGNVTHQRAWEASRLKLRVMDRINGQYQHAVGFWHLHPNIEVTLRDKSTVDLVLPSAQTAVLVVAGAELALEETTWHPGFGESVPNTRIVFKFNSPTVITEVCWGND